MGTTNQSHREDKSRREINIETSNQRGNNDQRDELSQRRIKPIKRNSQREE